MILAAITLELLPFLAAASDISDMVAIVVGFTFGVALMVGLEYVLHDDDALESAADSDTPMSSSMAKTLATKSKISLAQLNLQNPRNLFPVALAVSVYIDAVVDGTSSAHLAPPSLIPCPAFILHPPLC
jgi:hypothetical protein